MGLSQLGENTQVGTWPKQRTGAQAVHGLWVGEVDMVDSGLGLLRDNPASPQPNGQGAEFEGNLPQPTLTNL